MVVKLISDFGMRISDFVWGDTLRICVVAESEIRNPHFEIRNLFPVWFRRGSDYEKIFTSPHTKSEIRIPKSAISSCFIFE